MSSQNNIPLELHACMGLNACKGHDRLGTNECAGMGTCATAAEHSCHTLNNCRGQGGCGLYGTAEEQNRPGDNPCSWQGSCAVPINAERFSTDGPNQGEKRLAAGKNGIRTKDEPVGPNFWGVSFASWSPHSVAQAKLQSGLQRLRRKRHERWRQLYMNTDRSPIAQLQAQVAAMPNLGLGLGLRHVHFDYIQSNWPAVDWFEVISENFMFSAGRPRHVLRQVAERYPVVMHGVSLSIGSTAPIDFGYLKALRELAAEVHPQWISDHLCWTGVLGANTHDLLPLPLTEEAFRHVVDRVRVVQDYLERPLVLENPSTYLSFTHATIPEPEFLSGLVAETGCGLLLDVNNTYVTCFNAGLDPVAYIETLPQESIVQMHLAGHQHCGTHIIDTHDRPVVSEVWELFRLAWNKTGGVSTLLEWDGNIPSFEACLAELHKARSFMGQAAGEAKPEYTVPITYDGVATPHQLFSAADHGRYRFQLIDMNPNSKHLAEIQAWMQQALMFPGQADSQEGAVMHIAPSHTLSAAQRLAIYQRGYFARLLQCLEGQYKALCHALGKELFDDFSKEYLRKYPSTSPTLALLGARFPDFLHETRPDQEASEKEPWVEFMISLAQFEWDLYSMFDAPGHEGKAYAGASDAEENLRLQPCFSIHEYDFPVSAYYSAVAGGKDPDIPAPQEHFVAIVRKDFRTAIFDLLPPQYTFIQEMMTGKTVKEALGATAGTYHKPEEEAREAWAAWKKTWLEAGFFIANGNN